MAEYGLKRGVPRILKLLDDYDIKATFYIPGYVAENYEDMVREIVRKGHEVGHHGYMHEAPGDHAAGPGNRNPRKGHGNSRTAYRHEDSRV